MKNRIFSAVLVLVLCVSLLPGQPLTAVGTEEPADPRIEGIAPLAVSGSTGNDESMEKAFDGDMNTKWCANNNIDKGWMVFRTDKPVRASALRVYHASSNTNGRDKPANNTRVFSLEVLADSAQDGAELSQEYLGNQANWHSILDVSNPDGKSVTTSAIDTVEMRRTYRLNVTKGDTASNWAAVRIPELQLFGVEKLENPMDVTLSPGEGIGQTNVLQIEKGSAYKLPPCSFTAPEGKKFSHWSVAGGSYAPGQSVTLNETAVITAIWKDIPYVNVTFDAGEGGSGTMDALRWDKELPFVLPHCTLTPPEGLGFSGWLVGETQYAEGESITLTGDTQITAAWADFTLLSADPATAKAQLQAGGKYTVPAATQTLVLDGDIESAADLTLNLQAGADLKIDGRLSTKDYALNLQGSSEGKLFVSHGTSVGSLNMTGGHVILRELEYAEPGLSVGDASITGGILEVHGYPGRYGLRYGGNLTVGGNAQVTTNGMAYWSSNGSKLKVTGGTLTCTGNPDRIAVGKDGLEISGGVVKARYLEFCDGSEFRLTGGQVITREPHKGTVTKPDAWTGLYSEDDGLITTLYGSYQPKDYTVEKGRRLVVEETAPENLTNNGTVRLPDGFAPASIASLGYTGSGEVKVGAGIYDNNGKKLTSEYPVTLKADPWLTAQAGSFAREGENFVFTVTNVNRRYSVAVTYTVGGVDKGSLTGAEGSYTIPGSAITGEIVINAKAVPKETPAGMKAEIWTPLDFVTDSSTRGDLAQDGYHWENNTLTINGLNLQVPSGDALVLPEGAKIVMAGDGRIYSAKNTGVLVRGDLVISGSGTLEAEAERFGAFQAREGSNFNALKSVTVEKNVHLKATSISENDYNDKLTLACSALTVRGSVTVNATGSGNRQALYCWSDLTIDHGTVTVERGLVNGRANINGGSYTQKEGTWFMKGGTVTGGAQLTGDWTNYPAFLAEEEVTLSGNSSVTITGGKNDDTPSIGPWKVTDGVLKDNGDTVYGGTRTVTGDIPAGANVTLASGSDVTFKAPVVNEGTVDNYGTMRVDSGFTNSGVVNNYGQIIGAMGGTAPVKHTKTTTYVDEHGQIRTVEAIILKENSNHLKNGIYVAEGNITIPGGLNTVGTEVSLILADGAELTLGSTELKDRALYGGELTRLTIYGQSKNTGRLHALSAKGQESIHIRSVNLYGGTLHGTGNLRLNDGDMSVYETFTVGSGTLILDEGYLLAKGAFLGSYKGTGGLVTLSDKGRASLYAVDSIAEADNRKDWRGIVRITKSDHKNRGTYLGGDVALTEDYYTKGEPLYINYSTTAVIPAALADGTVFTVLPNGAYKDTKVTCRVGGGDWQSLIVENGRYTLPAAPTGPVTVQVSGVTDGLLQEAPLADAAEYTGRDQNLVTAGQAASGGHMEYRLGETGQWSTTIPTARNRGSYTVYYRAVSGNILSDVGAVKVTIAPKTVDPGFTGTHFSYDGEVHKPTVNLTGVSADQFDIVYEKKSGSTFAPVEESQLMQSGTYRMTVQGKEGGNYVFSPSQTEFTIGGLQVDWTPGGRAVTFTAPGHLSSGTVIAAGYDDLGRMVGLSVRPLTAEDTGRALTVTAEGFAQASTLRVFLLDAYMQPITQVTEKP